MTDGPFTLPILECLRCGHHWHPRAPEKPRCCAMCKSPYWDVPSLQEKKLKQAVDDAFAPDGVAAFLQSLRTRGAKIHHFEIVSSDLTKYVVGSFAMRGPAIRALKAGTLDFVSMYQALGKHAQRRINEYYQSRIEQVPEPLKKKFAKEFRR